MGIFEKLISRKEKGGDGKQESVLKTIPIGDRIYFTFDKTDGEWQFNKHHQKGEADLSSLQKREVRFTNDNSVIDALETLELPCKIKQLNETEWDATLYMRDDQMSAFHAFVNGTHGIEHTDSAQSAA